MRSNESGWSKPFPLCNEPYPSRAERPPPPSRSAPLDPDPAKNSKAVLDHIGRFGPLIDVLIRMTSENPKLIQGGMGVAVSSWKLARAVAKTGQLGVVSGTALDTVLVRRLQSGDLDGSIREALTAFPFPEWTESILKKYFIPGGKHWDQPYARLPLPTVDLSEDRQRLMAISSFAEVFLAKKGHVNSVGINFLEKIQIPTLPSLYGALLAEVDYVLMGAGIPREIPGILDKLAANQDVRLRPDIKNASTYREFFLEFSPRRIFPGTRKELIRPRFLPIISSSVLATTLARKASGKVDGFIIEGPTAGGHNAPPRGPLRLDESGEPVYGKKDEVDLSLIRSLGLPFWMAGSYGSREGLREALTLGAAGIQIGTAFALCEESGLREDLKRNLLRTVKERNVKVKTDPLASSTGFPFKVAQIPETLSQPEIYDLRPRICDLGYLRTIVETAEGNLEYRCASEPVEKYLAKGGDYSETVGRKCLCNALMANVGMPQLQRNAYLENPLVTLGIDVNMTGQFLNNGRSSYSAEDVVRAILK